MAALWLVSVSFVRQTAVQCLSFNFTQAAPEEPLKKGDNHSKTRAAEKREEAYDDDLLIYALSI